MILIIHYGVNMSSAVHKTFRQLAIAAVIICITGMILLYLGHETNNISCEAEPGIVLQTAQCETPAGKNSSRVQPDDVEHLRYVMNRHRVRFKPCLQLITNSHSDYMVFPRWSRATCT